MKITIEGTTTPKKQNALIKILTMICKKQNLTIEVEE